MKTTEILSMLLAFCSLLISFLALILTILAFRHQKRKEFEDILFSYLEPISEFITQTEIIIDGGTALEEDIVNIEKKLIQGFESLYAYGKSHGLPNLVWFSTINPMQEPKSSFAYEFFNMEDSYKIKILNAENKEDEKDIAYEYCVLFRCCLMWVHDYSTNHLYNSHFWCEFGKKKKSLIDLNNYLERYANHGK